MYYYEYLIIIEDNKNKVLWNFVMKVDVLIVMELEVDDGGVI